MRLGEFTLATLLLACPALGQTGSNVNWPLYTGDVSGSRYKPLGQINASNFNKLQLAWHFKTDNSATARNSSWKARRIEVNGTVYTTAGSRRAVVALDAETGELQMGLWHE